MKMQDICPKSKLDEHFLHSKSCQFQVHTEVSRSKGKPFSGRLVSPTVANFYNILPLRDQGYSAIYLSPKSELSVPQVSIIPEGSNVTHQAIKNHIGFAG